MLWKSAVQRVFTKASPEYRAGLVMQEFEKEMKRAGILDNPLRIAAFFATVGIESGNMTALRENMNYSASQIRKVFGIGKHSAGISDAESKTLAKNPRALAERVYGLGNPKKAKQLGNTKAGDGFFYRGTGPFQVTGKDAVMKMLDHFHAGNIEELIGPRLIFSTAILYWTQNKLNAFADRDDTRALRKAVNGGYNGYADFKKMYDQLTALLTNGKTAQTISQPDSAATDIQVKLNAVGYKLKQDGKYGPKTIAAIRDFQKKNKLVVDGIAGAATVALLDARAQGHSPVDPPDMPVISDDAAKATGASAMGLGAVGEVVMSTARELTSMPLDSPYLAIIPAVLMIAGLGIVVWPLIRGKK